MRTFSKYGHFADRIHSLSSLLNNCNILFQSALARRDALHHELEIITDELVKCTEEKKKVFLFVAVTVCFIVFAGHT